MSSQLLYSSALSGYFLYFLSLCRSCKFICSYVQLSIFIIVTLIFLLSIFFIFILFSPFSVILSRLSLWTYSSVSSFCSDFVCFSVLDGYVSWFRNWCPCVEEARWWPVAQSPRHQTRCSCAVCVLCRAVAEPQLPWACWRVRLALSSAGLVSGFVYCRRAGQHLPSVLSRRLAAAAVGLLVARLAVCS